MGQREVEGVARHRAVHHTGSAGEGGHLLDALALINRAARRARASAAAGALDRAADRVGLRARIREALTAHAPVGAAAGAALEHPAAAIGDRTAGGVRARAGLPGAGRRLGNRSRRAGEHRGPGLSVAGALEADPVDTPGIATLEDDLAGRGRDPAHTGGFRAATGAESREDQDEGEETRRVHPPSSPEPEIRGHRPEKNVQRPELSRGVTWRSRSWLLQTICFRPCSARRSAPRGDKCKKFAGRPTKGS